MDIQQILVLSVFGVAVLYLIRMLYLNIKPAKKGGGCKTCSACSDFSTVTDAASAGKSKSKITS